MEIPGDPEKGLLSMVFREDGRWEQRQQGQCKVTEGSRGPGLARGGVEAQEANWVTSRPVRPTRPPQWPGRTRGTNPSGAALPKPGPPMHCWPLQPKTPRTVMSPHPDTKQKAQQDPKAGKVRQAPHTGWTWPERIRQAQGLRV